MLMVMSGLGTLTELMMNTDDTDDKDAHYWLIVYTIHYSCLPDHVFTWVKASRPLVGFW